ncbi:uncharacterized protein MELLADRAFT_73355 [Melampsora larici-populina 98AG31]|uniref:G-protein coupled receptors family 1 profile domain-containing protein n=1 Tax=Melampsora larici-populina (strain 98AG31 / pathotype 3-4-7) TaxID=747676 RepID=F4S6W6_MELLP|nr:uncharacterized protein MELLADRAFT_73355 [Melampsora larici-populina 98AG31]EGF99648.1 hypothetical protein MELLADRAFT_73355 [Melampsora larici-populina 98AG31]
MNGTFILLAITPNAPIIWGFIRINSEYLAIKTALAPIMNNLLRSAIDYSPNTYSQAMLIAQLLPAQAALPHLDNIQEYLRVPMACYLSSVVILSVAYLQFLYQLVKESRKFRIIAEVEREEETKSYLDDEADRIRYLNNRIRQQHDAVLQHVVMTYISTIVFIPVLIWMFIGSFQDAYIVKPHWWNIALIGLHGPYAVVTSISLFLLQKTTS